jgi:hypothetical protein
MVVARKPALHHRHVTTVVGKDRFYRVQVFSVFRQHARPVGAQEKRFAKNVRLAEDTGSPKSLWNEK